MNNPRTRNKWHTILDGEDILLIAQSYGFRTWQTIYEHEKNASFRQQNPDPTMPHAGDQVWIPEKTVTTQPCQTGTAHTFVLKTLTSWLNLILQDKQGQPYAHKKYEIQIDGQVYGNEERRTDADGRVYVEIPVTQVVQLSVWFQDEGTSQTYTLQMGDMDPISTIQGVQDRLKNLGYYHGGDPWGEVGAATRTALTHFQSDYHLPVTNAVDEATRAKLKEIHNA